MIMTTKTLTMLAGAAALAIGLSGCSQQAAKAADPAQSAAAAAQIKAGEAAWVKEYANRDMNRAVAHYAGDAMLMPAGMDRMSGTKAIRSGLDGLAKDPNFQLSF